jgi:glutamate-1-semialdehyde 2,1-aminomutase
MDQVLPAGKVFQAGTLSGNPVAVAAGNATLRILKAESPYEQLEIRSQRLAAGLDRAATAAGIEHVVQAVGSMITLFFQAGPVENWTDADKSDRAAFSRFFWGMIEQGIYLPCSQFEAMFVGITHDDSLIDQTISAAETVLRR